MGIVHRYRTLRGLVNAVVLTAAIVVLAGLPATSLGQEAEPYDLVLAGGRVIDPETGLDAIRHVGIRGDRIAEISTTPLSGREVVEVSELVVSPGFIDPHSHGQTNEANEYQAHDGVTTALELESGRMFVRRWLAARAGDAMINFGASAAHGTVRRFAMEHYGEQTAAITRLVETEGLESEGLDDLFTETANARYEPVEPHETPAMLMELSKELDAGALGIGVPVGYYPGATRDEIFRVFELAAARDAPIYTHIRDARDRIAPVQEMLANAAITGAPLHIVHLNSMALGDIGVALDMIAAAQARGLDVTTEVYPYTAASTSLESTLFDPGWRELMGISYGDLQWEETGERLTEETFATYREEGGTVIIHMMRPEWIAEGVASPLTMIGSDGMPYAPGAHPRSAGTFARVLGRYVREEAALSLMNALGKMTIRPARRLEGIAPSMRLKGRLQVGCDADITIFDPDTIIDTATFEDDLSFSEGVHHVMVGGKFVVREGATVEGVRPGRPILGRYRQ